MVRDSFLLSALFAQIMQKAESNAKGKVEQNQGME